MEVTENKVNRSKKDMMMDRLRNKYPEQQFADEEEIYGRINDDYDAYDEQIGKQKEEEKKIVDMFSKYPQSADFLMAWKDGKDPMVEFVRRYGSDALDIKDDEEKLGELAKANREYLDRVSEQKSLEEQYQKNLAESLELMDRVQKERGINDAKMDAAMDFVFGIVSNGLLGKFDEKTIDLALKASNYDADVAEARMEGEVAGKNTKINEKLRKQKMGDGIPNLAGKNSVGMAKPKASSLFDIANEAR